MSDLIQLTVVGRLTRDAELRQAGESQVCRFTVAAKPYRAEESLFFNVSLWGKRGESLRQYLGKGQSVVVLGDYEERKYESNGEERVSRDLRASQVVLVGAKSERSEAATEGDDKDESWDF